MSASTPQTIEPSTVPVSAKNGTSDAVAFGTAYSATIPGMVKPRLAGFMMSMMSAITSTAISPQWASDSGASSGGDTTMSCDCGKLLRHIPGQQPVGRDPRRRR